MAQRTARLKELFDAYDQLRPRASSALTGYPNAVVLRIANLDDRTFYLKSCTLTQRKGSLRLKDRHASHIIYESGRHVLNAHDATEEVLWIGALSVASFDLRRRVQCKVELVTGEVFRSNRVRLVTSRVGVALNYKYGELDHCLQGQVKLESVMKELPIKSIDSLRPHAQA
jgi:hypothetical protein